MEQTITFVNNLGLKLAGIISMPKSDDKLPLVVMCHGYASGKNSKINRLLVPKLNDLGIASFRFDFTGHYDSEGDIADVTISSAVEDLNSAVHYLNSFDWINPDSVGIFGSSFGGTVALWFTASYGNIRAIALRSPVSDYAAVRELQLGEQGISDWKEQGYAMLEGGTVRSKYAFYEDSKSRDTYKLVKSISANTLIIHGDADDNVPLSQSKRLYDVMSETAILEVIPDAGHSYDKPGQIDRVVHLSVDFLNKFLKQ